MKPTMHEASDALTSTISVRVTDLERDDFHERAGREQRTVSNFIRRLLRDWLAQPKR